MENFNTLVTKGFTAILVCFLQGGRIFTHLKCSAFFVGLVPSTIMRQLNVPLTGSNLQQERRGFWVLGQVLCPSHALSMDD